MARSNKSIKTDAKPKRRIAEWLSSHFEEALNAHENLVKMTHLSERAISLTQAMPNVVKALQKAMPDGQTRYDNRLQEAEETASLAKAEIEKSFPILRGQYVIAMWSWLEYFVKGTLALWLLHNKRAMSVSAIQKLKITGEALTLSKREQSHLLVELLEQSQGGAFKQGVNRFENLLEPFGLAGTLPDKLSPILFEMQQVRNVLAHQNGIADRRLVTSCPHLKIKAGQRVAISGAMISRYTRATSAYYLELLIRFSALDGIDVSEHRIPLDDIDQNEQTQAAPKV